jgi:hypothetical protein
MKAQMLFLIAAVVISFSSCKKNNDEENNIKGLFSNTTWTGEAKYTARSVAEPFCVRFDASGTFIWYELDGEYPGTFTIDKDKKTVTILFSGGTTFTGTVADNNKLINLRYGATYPWAVTSFEKNDDKPDLDATTWNGFSRIEPTVTPRTVIITFKLGGNSLDYKETYTGGSYSVPNGAYQRKHAAISFSFLGRKLFGVINNGQIKGIEQVGGSGSVSNWKVTK